MYQIIRKHSDIPPNQTITVFVAQTSRCVGVSLDNPFALGPTCTKKLASKALPDMLKDKTDALAVAQACFCFTALQGTSGSPCVACGYVAP